MLWTYFGGDTCLIWLLAFVTIWSWSSQLLRILLICWSDALALHSHTSQIAQRRLTILLLLLFLHGNAWGVSCIPYPRTCRRSFLMGIHIIVHILLVNYVILHDIDEVIASSLILERAHHECVISLGHMTFRGCRRISGLHISFFYSIAIVFSLREIWIRIIYLSSFKNAIIGWYGRLWWSWTGPKTIIILLLLWIRILLWIWNFHNFSFV